jgi:hypothetical protein
MGVATGVEDAIERRVVRRVGMSMVEIGEVAVLKLSVSRYGWLTKYKCKDYFSCLPSRGAPRCFRSTML